MKISILMATSRILNLFDLTALGVGSSLGVGIYVLLGELTRNVAGPAVVASIGLAGFAAIIAGLCLLEFGIRFFKSDSTYIYSYACSRENFAFIIGWTLILKYVAGGASVAKGIITFIDALTENKTSNFLRECVPIDFEYVSPYYDFLSQIIILLLMIPIALDIQCPIKIRNIFTLCTLVLICSIIIAGSFKADVKNWGIDVTEEDETNQKSFSPFGFLGLAKAASIAFYGYIGFDTINISGHEITKRRRNISLATLGTLIITLVVYTGMGTILTLIWPYQEHNINAALPFAFEKIGWIALQWIIILGAFLAFLTSLFGVTYPLPKVIYSMANDGLLFHFLGNTHPKFQTPLYATIIGGVLTIIAAGLFSFRQLVTLTVIATLFGYTIIAIDVTSLRYIPSYEEDEKTQEFTNFKLFSFKNGISVVEIVRNCFNFKAKVATKLTGMVVLTNLFVFCIFSIGLSSILIFFFEGIIDLRVEAILPATLFLVIMLFTFISVTFQPKPQKVYPFKTPLVPFVPLLGIFLFIFFMVLLDSVTWIHFAIWMILGLIPHLIWYGVKCYKGQTGDSSLYEINRMNALKLNDSVWKIEIEKKSFYNGAINPGYFEESEVKSEETITVTSGDKIKRNVQKASMQLKQAEIIQAADLDNEEKIEPLQNKMEDVEMYDVVKINGDEIENHEVALEEEERVQWECVAEIHKEEVKGDTVALEVVDNVYNFLSDDNEMRVKKKKAPPIPKFKEEAHSADKPKTTPESNKKFDFTPPETPPRIKPQGDNSSTGTESSEDSLLFSLMKKLNERNQRLQKKSNLNGMEDEISQKSEKSAKSSQRITEISQKTLEEKGEKNKLKVDGDEKDEKNSKKEFKEKLNQLLKNHLTPKSSTLTYPRVTKEISNENILENNKEDYTKVKTLSKAQIKNKLDFILSKGPPKKPSFRDSFNIKLKKENLEGKLTNDEDIQDDIVNNNNNNKVRSTKNSVDVNATDNNTEVKTVSDNIKELQSDAFF